MKKSKTGKNIRESGLVSSKQNGVHPHLNPLVIKHLEKPWKQPLHSPTVDVFRLLGHEGVFSSDQPIILDSGCGTGQSSQRLTELFPEHLVIGVDQSDKRLARSGVSSNYLQRDNCVLVRAELATFWRLMFNGGIKPDRHFLFYPNPWPKPGHLSRRWHGHPVFPTLLALGGEIELRCNWGVYAQEFAQAVGLLTKTRTDVSIFQPHNGISPFEQKYLERGQTLYSVCVPAPCLNAFSLSEPVA